MCGILGFASDQIAFDHIQFTKNLDLLSHRGPDHADFWIDSDCKNFMGFRRLSIMDLTNLGNQPMISQCKKYILIFNGEIYNYISLRNELEGLDYIFNSQSDAEVLLNCLIEWKENCLEKIEGMFAFAFYDIDARSLILARDISGEKPLYYYHQNGSIAYSSEIKPLVKSINHKKILNKDSLNHYLGNGYIPREQSIFEGIKKLLPGEYLKFNIKTGEKKIYKYWCLLTLIKKNNAKPKQTNMNLTDKLEDLLQESLQKQLVSDAKLGMMLSGGVDSSLLVAMASRIKNKLDTFTVIFPDNKNYNEQKHAKLISQKFRTNHHELDAGSIEPELIEKLTYFFDEPMTDSSMLPTYLLCKEMSNFCKVAIGGDGADELFGGYSHYTKLLSMHKLCRYIPHQMRHAISRGALSALPKNMRGRKTIEILGEDLINLNFSSSLMFNYEDRKLLFSKYPEMFKEIIFKRNISGVPKEDFIKRMTLVDFKNYLSEDILVKVDRASMANSLEVRSPFLDKKIIEFVFTEIPSYKKIYQNQKKILLKDLCKKLLPNQFDLSRKQGFSIPINQLLISGKWYDFFYSKIQEFNGFEINKNFVFKLLEDQKTGAHNGEKLYSLVQLICWYERHIQGVNLESLKNAK
jgi:asparagine synthase (glutamine-hydrolysing)